MLAADIDRIMSKRLFPGKKGPVSLVETHASWVILTPEWAFKIKKPVQLGFLDFSTAEKRAFYCREEWRLNRRLCPHIYIDVLPVGVNGIGDDKSPQIDSAVQMRRVDNRYEMDKLLETQSVQADDMVRLSRLLANFHRQNRLTDLPPYDPMEDARDFADLYRHKDLILSLTGEPPPFSQWESMIPSFLRRHAPRIAARARQGFWIEAHGDLHSRNIFLPPGSDPIVFDCIEFNPHFRRMDVLNELAFLCMDLAFYRAEHLSSLFMEAYQKHWTCLETPEDERLFTYYKAYRANVRLKITLLQWLPNREPLLGKTALTYLDLLQRYCAELEKIEDIHG